MGIITSCFSSSPCPPCPPPPAHKEYPVTELPTLSGFLNPVVTSFVPAPAPPLPSSSTLSVISPEAASSYPSLYTPLLLGVTVPKARWVDVDTTRGGLVPLWSPPTPVRTNTESLVLSAPMAPGKLEATDQYKRRSLVVKFATEDPRRFAVAPMMPRYFINPLKPVWRRPTVAASRPKQPPQRRQPMIVRNVTCTRS